MSISPILNAKYHFTLMSLTLIRVYETMQPELANLPEGRVRAPFDQAYGHREFHVADEDCTLILFGEAIH